jgi:hypothetical protein
MGWVRLRDAKPVSDQAVDEPGFWVVQGVLEAVTHATFDLGSEQVFVNGPDGGRLGDVVHESHPAALAHPELFRPLRLSLGLRHDMIRDTHPAAREQPAAPQLAARNQQTVTERLNELWRGR